MFAVHPSAQPRPCAGLFLALSWPFYGCKNCKIPSLFPPFSYPPGRVDGLPGAAVPLAISATFAYEPCINFCSTHQSEAPAVGGQFPAGLTLARSVARITPYKYQSAGIARPSVSPAISGTFPAVGWLLPALRCRHMCQACSSHSPQIYGHASALAPGRVWVPPFFGSDKSDPHGRQARCTPPGTHAPAVNIAHQTNTTGGRLSCFSYSPAP